MLSDTAEDNTEPMSTKALEKEKGDDAHAIITSKLRVLAEGNPKVREFLKEAHGYTTPESRPPPLFLAFESGEHAILDMFLDNYSLLIDVSCNHLKWRGETVLHAAVRSRQLPFVALADELLQQHSSLHNSWSCSPLHIAAKLPPPLPSQHHTEKSSSAMILRYLLRQGLEVNSRDTSAKTPLHYVAETGDEEALAVLLEFGADPALMDDNFLHPYELAVKRGHKKIKTLLENASTVHTAFKVANAICRKSLTQLKKLLAIGFNINHVFNDGRTPLILAVQRRCPEIVRYLLKQPDCAVNFVSRDQTALHQNLEFIDDEYYPQIHYYLMLAGADVNIRNSNGHTMLMDLDFHFDIDIQECLENGADLNVVAPDGLTVLWAAVACGFCTRVSVVEELLANNMDVTISRHRHSFIPLRQLISVSCRIQMYALCTGPVTPLQLAYLDWDVALCDVLLRAGCSVSYLTEDMMHDALQTMGKDNPLFQPMSGLTKRILSMRAQPSSLKNRARRIILRAIGSGAFILKLKALDGILPKSLVTYLGENLKFKPELQRLFHSSLSNRSVSVQVNY